MSESYGCSRDPVSCSLSEPFPASSEPPFCVLKSFPFSPDHAVVWAKAKADQLLMNKPEKYNAFWKSLDEEEQGGGDLAEREARGNCD